jgi:hydroxymethylpyrimidine kinase / phosphomethylpyrimidine kinase / thiamine-phosphate diphosphorylase
MAAAGIKVGMLANNDIVASVAKYLADCRGVVVYDPVLYASNGASLFDDDGRLLRERLLPHVDLLTPNRFEAEFLLGRKLADIGDIEQAARDLVALGPRSVLITGGHFDARDGRRLDYWSDGVDGFWLAGPNIDTIHGHGTGCTLSSAIAAALARGFALADALVLAKMYVAHGLRGAVQLGGGPGAVSHTGWPRSIDDLPVLSRTLPGTGDAFPGCDGELGLYPVVDSAEWIERLLPLGVKTIQLRIKEQPLERVEEQVRRAVELSRRHGARLFINDYWQLAIRCGAYGVHLGQEDLDSADLAAIRAAGLRLGISNHSYYELARAHGVRPSYLALGPIFPTATKVMKFADQGLAQLAQWTSLLKPAYTLTAIGGIGPERVDAVLATGVGSCAMVSAITQADDYAGVVRDLLARIDGAGGALSRQH